MIVEYAAALSDGAKFPPVRCFDDGVDLWLADGFHRVLAHEEIGVKLCPAIVHAGGRRDAQLYSTGANADHGLRRTNADKRRAVSVLLNDGAWQRWSDGRIAAAARVSQQFVSSMRAEMTHHNGESQILRIGADGRTINVANITKRAPLPDVVDETWRAVLPELAAETTAEHVLAAARVIRKQTGGDRVYDGDEFGTPSEIVSAARKVLGRIDLDPASSAAAQGRVRATKFYDKKADGLTREWEGRVFVNPPYSHPLVERFAERLVEHVRRRQVTAAVLLVNVSTGSKWQQDIVLPACTAFCLLRGRLAFLVNDDQPMAGNSRDQAVFYFGRAARRFADVFGELGAVCQIVRSR